MNRAQGEPPEVTDEPEVPDSLAWQSELPGSYDLWDPSGRPVSAAASGPTVPASLPNADTEAPSMAGGPRRGALSLISGGVSSGEAAWWLAEQEDAEWEDADDDQEDDDDDDDWSGARGQDLDGGKSRGRLRLMRGSRFQGPRSGEWGDHQADSDWDADLAESAWDLENSRASKFSSGSRLGSAAGSGLLSFGRAHASVVLVALVVGIGIAVTYLFRAHAEAVPVGVSVTQSGSPTSSPSVPVANRSATNPTSPTSSSSQATPTKVVVAVLGAVRKPGVVTLSAGARVQDAIRACDGLAPGADPAELNLAATLQDADQVVIGTRQHPRGEVRSGSGSATSAENSGGSATSTPGSKVNLNTATLEQLDAIPGVGPVTAQKILQWRAQHGRFTSISELQEVDGIGPKSYTRIADYVRV